jgi:hypothetical protein
MFAHHHAFIPEVFRLVRFGDDESRLIGFTIPPFSLPARHSRAAYSRAPNAASVPTPASHSAGVFGRPTPEDVWGELAGHRSLPE